jgi:hypothetical protein
MLPFSKLNADADTLIEVLDLHFDPDTAIGEHTMAPASVEEEADNSEFSMAENVDEFAGGSSLQEDSGEFANVPDIDNTDAHGETLVVEEAWGGQDLSEDSQSEASGLDDIQSGFADNSMGEEQSSDNESEQTLNTESEDDAFGDISFDEFKDGDSTGFGDALTDVWGEESTQKDREIFSGEDMTDGSIDDSEIARLFPNS